MPKRKTPASTKQTRLANHKGVLRLEYKGKPLPATHRKSATLPAELYLMIAQLDPLVAVRMHPLNRALRELIRRNIIPLTQTRFLHRVEGIKEYSGEWSVKPCLRGLFYYFGKRVPAPDDLEDRADALIQHIEHRYLSPAPMHVRYWIRSLPEACLTTANARAHTLLVIRAARAHFGGLYLHLGNDEKGTRRFALAFLAFAERMIETQFRACYHFSTRSFKFTCNTREYYEA